MQPRRARCDVAEVGGTHVQNVNVLAVVANAACVGNGATAAECAGEVAETLGDSDVSEDDIVEVLTGNVPEWETQDRQVLTPLELAQQQYEAAMGMPDTTVEQATRKACLAAAAASLERDGVSSPTLSRRRRSRLRRRWAVAR